MLEAIEINPKTNYRLAAMTQTYAESQRFLSQSTRGSFHCL